MPKYGIYVRFGLATERTPEGIRLNRESLQFRIPVSLHPITLGMFGETMERSSDFFSIFIDLMGFADSLEALNSEEHELLTRVLNHETVFNAPRSVQQLGTSYHALHRTIANVSSFYRGLIHAVIMFSDSAFVVTPHQLTASGLAIKIMQEMYDHSIPARMGVAGGTFTRLAFSTTTDTTGMLLTQSPFLGTAIVRAYRAQACPSLGFRIFVHPSAAVDSPDLKWIHVDLPAHERTRDCTQELNFLDYWNEHQHHDEYPQRGFFYKFGEMQRNCRTDKPRVLAHYEATRMALQRLFEVAENHQWKPEWDFSTGTPFKTK